VNCDICYVINRGIIKKLVVYYFASTCVMADNMDDTKYYTNALCCSVRAVELWNLLETNNLLISVMYHAYV